MNFQFYFGPDKVPFRLLDNGMAQSDSAIPFHGIISRGLLNKFIEQNLNVALWHHHAHNLFDNFFDDATNEFPEIQKHARKCKVLSFSQSTYAAQKYIEIYCKKKKIVNPQIELWNTKEGHTSSVWKILIRKKKVVEIFVINVSRDYEAGIELKKSSEKLMDINNQFPESNMARVYEIYILKDKSLPSEVIITRNAWIDNAFEIHSRKNRQTGEEELIMVDRFLTDAKNPAQITSVLGKIFTPSEASKIKNELNKFLTKANESLQEKPEININDGDVVWNGEKAIIIAIS